MMLIGYGFMAKSLAFCSLNVGLAVSWGMLNLIITDDTHVVKVTNWYASGNNVPYHFDLVQVVASLSVIELQINLAEGTLSETSSKPQNWK